MFFLWSPAAAGGGAARRPLDRLGARPVGDIIRQGCARGPGLLALPAQGGLLALPGGYLAAAPRLPHLAVMAADEEPGDEQQQEQRP